MTELPLNLPALEAGVVRTWIWIVVPRLKEHSKIESPKPDRPHTWEPYLNWLAQPLEVKVELHGLDGKTFRNVITRPPSSVVEAPSPLY